MLRTSDVCGGYGQSTIIRNLSLEIPVGKITCVVGPNGCGKSTLLRMLSGLLRPSQGQLSLLGRNMSAWSRKALAKQLTMLPQKPLVPDGITVEGLVRLGRFAHGSWWRSAPDDHAIVAESMVMTQVDHLRARAVGSLSGGQQQRAWLAMALAQQTPYLLLDEPTTYLDWGHQLAVLELLRSINLQRQITIVMSLHELNQAAKFSDHLVVLRAGQLHSHGVPGNVLTPELLNEVFGIRGGVLRDDEDNPYCVAYGTHGR